MSTYRNNDHYTDVGTQAASDLKKVARLALTLAIFVAPIIISMTAMVIAQSHQNWVMIGMAGVSIITMLVHAMFATVRFFGRNEQAVWKADLEEIWFTWTKWTVWPLVIAITSCVLMLLTYDAVVVGMLMDAQEYIRSILG